MKPKAASDTVVRVPNVLVCEEGFSLPMWLELHGIDTRLVYGETSLEGQCCTEYRQRWGERRQRIPGDDLLWRL